ncbi:MAG: D-alanyl-D-alanine carboxypeptidase/D-alanyl-D-alanine-endopeptidase, partial [Bacteroidales bacterium]|nr:D-alanyl-D-alanine carboxypeptidase/D-alanyl-D-alanine-endopeptidase [Bacteroidales bacterium]
MKRPSIFFLFIILCFSLFSQNKTAQEVLDNFISEKELKNASISIYAENLSNNTIIFDYNSHLALAPASVLKLLPTSMALELFGAEHKFKTELAYSGNITADGVLNGDLYIIGYGDPCLGSQNFTANYGKDFEILQTWTNEIKKLNIKKIKGNIIADISYFGEIPIPDNWIWEDIANYYGNQGSTLNFIDNLYYLHFKTGQTNGSPTIITKVEPEDLGYRFDNQVVASSTIWDDAFIYFTNDKNQMQVKGSLVWKKNDFTIKGSIREPEKYLVKAFARTLNSNGINLEGNLKVVDNFDTNIYRKVFYTCFSPILSEIVDYTNIRSFNLYAEILAQHIMKKTGKSWNESVIEFLGKKSIDIDGLKLSDACGLSRFNAITSRQIVGILKYMKLNSANKDKFFTSLPIAGTNGTMS